MSSELSSGGPWLLILAGVIVLGLVAIYGVFMWRGRRKTHEVGQASVAGPAAKDVADEPLSRSPPIARAQSQSQSQGPR